MKIISKRGRPLPVAKISSDNSGYYGIIIVDANVLTPEEKEKAEESAREIRRQLDQLQDILYSFEPSDFESSDLKSYK